MNKIIVLTLHLLAGAMCLDPPLYLSPSLNIQIYHSCKRVQSRLAGKESDRASGIDYEP